MSLPIAFDLGPETFGLAVPIIIFLIPIVAILTKHQQKMAEIMHSGALNQGSNREVEILRAEVGELKAMIQQQTIAIDNLQMMQRQPTKPLSETLDLGSRG
jgi:hypothetical protein